MIIGQKIKRSKVKMGYKTRRYLTRDAINSSHVFIGFHTSPINRTSMPPRKRPSVAQSISDDGSEEDVCLSCHRTRLSGKLTKRGETKGQTSINFRCQTWTRKWSCRSNVSIEIIDWLKGGNKWRWEWGRFQPENGEERTRRWIPQSQPRTNPCWILADG